MRANVYSMIGLHLDLETKQQVNVYIDVPKDDDKRSDQFDVLYCQEPPEINAWPTQYARDNVNRFDLIIVSTDELIGLSDKVVPLELGTTTIQEWKPVPKADSVSMVAGHKTQTDGHQLRHEIWHRQHEIKARKNFYISQHGGPANPWGWPALGATKAPLFDSKFHIAIENTRARYWFTEKLIDCFLTFTIPIYWGCLNLGDYFNTQGVLWADTADDIIRQANSINAEMYYQMAGAMFDNWKRAAQYVDLGARLAETIKAHYASSHLQQ